MTSDEVAETFDAKMSDSESGIHSIPLTNLTTWTQTETYGSFTLSNYNFMLKVAGQNQVVEEVVHPKVHGFQKRLKQVWSLAEIPTHDQQLFGASDKLIQDWHDWMHSNCVEQPPVVISKLVFFHSAVLCEAHKVFRSVQFRTTAPVFRSIAGTRCLLHSVGWTV